MTSPNNHPRGTHGSALVVTILLVSVMLTAALILLQRIIPYAKNVRSMHDAVQSYYTARGETEAANFGFFYNGGEWAQAFRLPTLFQLLAALTFDPTITRPAIDRLGAGGVDRQTVVGNIIELKLPYLADPTRDNRDYVVSSSNYNVPLQIRLFEKDSTPRYFGTSKIDPMFHTLYSKKSGGMRFDLRGVPTRSVDDSFTLDIKFRNNVSLPAKLTIKMQYADSSNPAFVKTFSQTIGSAIAPISSPKRLTGLPDEGTTQIIGSNGDVTATYSTSFADFLTGPVGATTSCEGATICSLTLTLDGIPSVDFQLISNATSPIPDLNAVVIGDGLSDNGLYFQRVMDLIPTRQDI